MITDLKIKQRNVVWALMLTIFGVVVDALPFFANLFPHGLNAIFSFLFGVFALVVLFGQNQFKQLVRPMKKPFVKKIFLALLGALAIRYVLAIIAVLAHLINIHAVSGPQALTIFKTPDLLSELYYFVIVSISIVGEELVIAVPILTLFYYLKRSNNQWLRRHAWIISSIIGAFIFSLFHLEAYRFNFIVCLIVGMARLPFTQAWKSTDSLRGGIYVHLLFDWLTIVPMLF